MTTEHAVVLYWHHSLNCWSASASCKTLHMKTNITIYFYLSRVYMELLCISSLLSPFYKALRKCPLYTTLITLEMIIQSKVYNRGPCTLWQRYNTLIPLPVPHKYHMGLWIYTSMYVGLWRGFLTKSGNTVMLRRNKKSPSEVRHTLDRCFHRHNVVGNPGFLTQHFLRLS